MKLEQIKKKYQGPLIGIIGASFPTPEYSAQMGRTTGEYLRKMVESYSGTLFTGGMSGAGADAYAGIAAAENANGYKSDRFLILFPQVTDKASLKFITPSSEYEQIAKQYNRRSPPVEDGGSDFIERRQRLAELADIVIMINGAEGTMDEALRALLLKKSVYILEESGGAAEFLASYAKNRAVVPGSPLDFKKVRSFKDSDELKSGMRAYFKMYRKLHTS